jgi:hypothetical protein
MKRAIILFLPIFIGFSCKTRNENSDWVKLNLNGKVKSIREISYNAFEKFGEAKKTKRGRRYSWEYDTLFIFNKFGQFTEKYLFNSDDSAVGKFIYSYDNTRFVKKIIKYDSTNKVEYSWHFYYDTRFNLLESSLVNNNFDTTYSYKYKYDNLNNIINEYCYYSDGSLVYSNTYNYDTITRSDGTQKVQVNKTYFNSFNVSINKLYNHRFNNNSYFEYQYDVRENLVELIEITINWGLFNREHHWDYNLYQSYDYRGLLISTNFSNKGDYGNSCTYKYDEKNRITAIEYSFGNIIYFLYDDRNNIIEEKRIQDKYDRRYINNKIISIKLPDKNRWLYSYKYDSHDNIVEYKENDKITYSYDYIAGIVEVTMYNSNDSIITNYKYKYDNKVVKYKNYNVIVGYNLIINRTTYAYEYDKNGNWIKRTEYENNTPNYIVERLITYF